MPASKDPSRYPSSYFGYYEAGYKSGIRLQSDNPHGLRFRLYNFAHALRAQGHPHKFFADNTTLLVRAGEVIIQRVDAAGDGVTSFQTITEGTPAQILQPLMSNPLPTPLASMPERELPKLDVAREMVKDPMESALEKLGFFTNVKKREAKDDD